MTNRITDVANNFQTTLTQQVGPDSTTFPVADRGGLTSPCFITIAPDDPNKREVVLCDGVFGASSFECSVVQGRRGLPGSAIGAPFLHEVDTPVVVSPLAQHIDDLNDRISEHGHTGATDGAPLDHGGLAGRNDDDHALYPLVTGVRGFSGPVSGVTPTASTHLGTKGYIDGADAVLDADKLDVTAHTKALHDGLGIDHGSLAGLGDDDHPHYLTDARHTALAGAHVTNGDSHNHSGGDGAQIDHGALGGLGDNDHTQYARKASTETISGAWNFTGSYLRVDGDDVVRGSVERKLYVSTNGPSGGNSGDIWFEY